eukprot:6127962-Pleurochrysis_carterae.AAC.2
MYCPRRFLDLATAWSRPRQAPRRRWRWQQSARAALPLPRLHAAYARAHSAEGAPRLWEL